MLQTQNDLCNVRLSLSEASLPNGYIVHRKIQVPQVINYRGFSGLFSQSLGGNVGHGYKTVVFTWTNINHITSYRIKKFVDDAKSGSGLLYATVPYNDGSTLSRVFIDISGVPQIIDIAEAGNFSNVGVYFPSLELKLNAVTILNNPALNI